MPSTPGQCQSTFQARYLRVCGTSHWIPILIAVLLCGSCGKSDLEFSADPISARVVDADTGVALAGVNVVSAWEVKAGMGHILLGYIDVREDVTDGDGRFRFPGWGPKRNIFDRGSGVSDNSPLLVFFKRNYIGEVVGNGRPVGATQPLLHMTSDYDGRTIRLKKFDGPAADYASNGSNQSVKDQIHHLLGNNQCNWQSIPRILWATSSLQEELDARGVDLFGSLDSLELSDQKNRRRCGSLKRFVEEHGK